MVAFIKSDERAKLGLFKNEAPPFFRQAVNRDEAGAAAPGRENGNDEGGGAGEIQSDADSAKLLAPQFRREDCDLIAELGILENAPGLVDRRGLRSKAALLQNEIEKFYRCIPCSRATLERKRNSGGSQRLSSASLIVGRASITRPRRRGQ